MPASTDTFDWSSLISPAVGALGTIYAANNAANTQQSIANQSTLAGQQAAQLAQFRPIGVTSRFGQSGFQYDPSGQLTGAGYQVAPDIAAQREALLGMSGGALTQAQAAQGYQPQLAQGAQGLFNLGQQYIAQSPQAAATDWMANQNALLRPGQEQAYAQTQQGLFNSGRGGLSVAQGGNLGAANPEQQAYYNALAQQQAGLAAQAQQQGQQQATFGAGLMGAGTGLLSGGYNLQNTALTPYTNYLAGAQTLEGLGQQALTQGASLGSSQATAGANAGNALLSGVRNAQGPLTTGAAGTTAATTGAIAGLTDPIAALIASLTRPATNTGTTLTQQQYANISGY